MAIVTAMNCPTCEGEGVAGGVECATCAGTGEVESTQDEPTQAAPSLSDVLEAAAPPAVAAALVEAPQDEVSKALAEVTQKTNTILSLAAKGRELAERYRNVGFDVRTTKGMEEAKAARLALREEVRYPMQKLRDERSKMLGTMQRQANISADALIEEVERYEAPIHEQIQAEENRKEAERAERAAAEQRRIDGHLQAIAAINGLVTAAMGLTSAELEQAITNAQGVVVDEGYEEFQGQAQQAKDETLRQLQGLLVAARAEEAELEETRRQQAALAAAQQQLEADRRAQAEQARQLAEREKAIAEREAQQQAEDESLARARQERAEAVQRRIDGIHTAGAPLDGRSAEELQGILNTLQGLVFSAELLDDRVSEAVQARDARVANVQHALAEAQAREAEEAARAQAARIQELIDNIRGMGENATLAVQDGSADVEGLRAGLAELDGLELVELGGREQEAALARQDARLAIDEAIAATIERDRLRAEEEERRRQEEAEAAAARALADAKRSLGEELYEAVRALLLETLRSGDHEADAYQRGRALLLSINPAEDFED